MIYKQSANDEEEDEDEDEGPAGAIPDPAPPPDPEASEAEKSFCIVFSFFPEASEGRMSRMRVRTSADAKVELALRW